MPTYDPKDMQIKFGDAFEYKCEMEITGVRVSVARHILGDYAINVAVGVRVNDFRYGPPEGLMQITPGAKLYAEMSVPTMVRADAYAARGVEAIDEAVRKAILKSLEHEVDEWLRRDGEYLANPHPYAEIFGGKAGA